MTSPVATCRQGPAGTLALVAVTGAGCLLLMARPVLLPPGGPVSATVALFLGLGVVGIAWPLPHRIEPVAGRRATAVVLAIGIAGFAGARLLAGGSSPAPATAGIIAVNSLAAVAEEGFFRRLIYAALLPARPGVAVAGSALLFAAIHLTVYGAWVLPIDLAAGLLLSWQRQASGSWGVPAVTHVWANLLAVA